jgi:hypothetical protein
MSISKYQKEEILKLVEQDWSASEFSEKIAQVLRPKPMDNPRQVNLPFFAYGVFKPGELAYHRVRDLVLEVKSVSAQGRLLLRDGLPLIDPDGPGEVCGSILFFKPQHEAEAYKRIVAIEPDRYYRWEERNAQGTLANVLVGRYRNKGSVPFEGSEWRGREDPLFKEAVDVVEETLRSSCEFRCDLKPLFRLQMAYLLLWSSIERYLSLRYHLGNKVVEKVNYLAEEAAFARALQQNVQNRRPLYRADSPGQKRVLDPSNPRKSLDYYYQIRSNITHRGKAVVQDHNILKDSLSELLKIFKSVLEAAFAE